MVPDEKRLAFLKQVTCELSASCPPSLLSSTLDVLEALKVQLMEMKATGIHSHLAKLQKELSDRSLAD